VKRTASILNRRTAARLHLRLVGGFALVLAVSAGQSFFAYRTAIENSAAGESVTRGEQILGVVAKVRSDLLHIEAGYSGFLLAGNDTFLDSYTAGALAYGTDLAALRELSMGNANEEARWQDLEWRGAASQRDVTKPTIAGGTVVPSRIGLARSTRWSGSLARLRSPS